MSSLSTPAVLTATLVTVFILSHLTNQRSSIAQKNRNGGLNSVSTLPFWVNQSRRCKVNVPCIQDAYRELNS